MVKKKVTYNITGISADDMVDDVDWADVDTAARALMDAAYQLDGVMSKSRTWGIPPQGNIASKVNELIYGNPIIQFYRGAHYAKAVDVWKAKEVAKVLKSDGREKK